MLITILCTISFLILTWFSFTTFSSREVSRRIFDVPGNRSQRFLMPMGMYFVMFIVLTAPLYVRYLTLVRYLIFFVLSLYYILNYKYNNLLRGGPVVISYMIFYMWLVLTAVNSPYPDQAFLNLLKYSLPIVSLWVAYNALQTKEDFIVFLKYSCWALLIYSFWVGGFSAKFLPFLYYSPFGAGIVYTYAQLGDYFVAMLPIPITYAIITGKKRWLLLVVWLFLSSISESIRTTIAASLIAISIYAFLMFKLRSVPFIIGLVFVFSAIVVYVPEVNKKFFAGGYDNNYTVQDIATGKMGMKNIQTNAREMMWEKAMTDLYDGHELTGSGLGSVSHGMKTHKYHDSLLLIHSDYVQLLCDSGIISVVLLGVFVLCTLVTVLWYGQPWMGEFSALSGWMAASSLGGILFCMAFDNVVSVSMTSLIMPFFFIGFFLKFKDLYKYLPEKDFTAELPEEEFSAEFVEEEPKPQLEAESK